MARLNFWPNTIGFCLLRQADLNGWMNTLHWHMGPSSRAPPWLLGRGDPTSRCRHKHTKAFAFASPSGGRKGAERASHRGRLLGPEPYGVHAAGQAGLLLRRRGGRRRERGLLPLQGLQARQRLHGPQGTHSAPLSHRFVPDLRLLRAYRYWCLGDDGSPAVISEEHRHVACGMGDPG